MKKQIFMLGILALGIGQLSAQVTIYEQKNFGGKSKEYTQPEGYNMPDAFGSGKIGSIKVAPGWAITITDSWSDEAGRSQFTSDIKDLVKEGYSGKAVFVQIEKDKAAVAANVSKNAALTNTANTLKSGETLVGGQQLTSANGKFILKIQELDGHLCVYKFENGRQGAFVWGSGIHGFKGAKLVMQTDGNLVVNQGNAPKWNSGTHPYFNDKFKSANNKPVKLVLENDGSLKLYTASNSVVWTNK